MSENVSENKVDGLTEFKSWATLTLAAVFVFGCAVGGLLLPDSEVSSAERRPLAQLPALSAKSVLNGQFMSDFEAYSLDQFPLRDDFRGIKAGVAAALGRQDNNGIYAVGKYLAALEYPYDENSAAYAAERMRYVYQQYLAESGGKVYLSIVPDKGYFLAAESGRPALDYQALAADMQEGLPFAEYIDIFGELTAADYYYTDAHWRQENLLPVAEKLAEGLGVKLSAEYECREAEQPFYGVYAGQYALPHGADTLRWLTNETLAAATVYDYESQGYLPVYDESKLDGDDPYEMFLGGAKSLLVLENPAAGSDRELIVFRDSFGSSLVPLLAEAYAKITLVDIRYVSPAFLGNFMQFDGQDVLFLYSTGVLNNSVTIK